MSRTTRVFSLLALGAALLIPRPAFAQAQQQVDDLRRRVEEVERQLFQQRLAAPVSPQGQAIDRLQMRLDALERDIMSARISETAQRLTETHARAGAAAPTPLEARIEQLEQQRAEDAKTIKALIARIQKLEKPTARPKAIKR